MVSPVIAQRPALFSLHLTKEQAIKVVSVAIVAFSYFGWVGAFLTAGLTFLCEASLRQGSEQNWFSAHTFSFERVLSNMKENAVVSFVCLVSWVALAALGLAAFPSAPLQSKLVEMALAKPLRTLFLATVVAPICEEILFRGFLQERIEDAISLAHRYIYPIPREVQQRIANLGQALLFGWVHIVGGQVISSGSARRFVFLVTSNVGYVLAENKERTSSLLEPIATHSTHNALAALGFGIRRFLGIPWTIRLV